MIGSLLTSWIWIQDSVHVDRLQAKDKDNRDCPISSLSINFASTTQVSCAKSLGVLIDETLSWNEHIEEIISTKIASGTGALKCIRPFAPPSTLPVIYNSPIQPHFDYCCVVWGNCGKTLDVRCQIIKTRILTFSSYDTSGDYLLELLGWKKNWISSEMFKKLLWSINHLTVLPQIIYVLNLWAVAGYQPIH